MTAPRPRRAGGGRFGVEFPYFGVKQARAGLFFAAVFCVVAA